MGSEPGAPLKGVRTRFAAEEGTVAWMAFQTSYTSYRTFDTSKTEEACQDDLPGEIPHRLVQVAQELLVAEPDIQLVDVIAVK
jgi:hypothetical protein